MTERRYRKLSLLPSFSH